MKKILAFFLTVITLLSLVACGSNQQEPAPTAKPTQSTTTNTPKPVVTVPAGPSDEDLEDIVSALADAEEDADRMASMLLKYWTTDSYFVYFYDESRFRGSSFEEDEDFADVHKYRGNVEDALKEAKSTMGTNGSSDFYKAVKEYYMALDNYLALLSEYPTGYSKLTYATAISDCQDECRSARTNAEFYAD